MQFYLKKKQVRSSRKRKTREILRHIFFMISYEKIRHVAEKRIFCENSVKFHALYAFWKSAPVFSLSKIAYSLLHLTRKMLTF
jgi:hypothetical protein